MHIGENHKQRFFYRADPPAIKLAQGHSAEVGELIDDDAYYGPPLTANQLPVCIHSTYAPNVEQIQREGLVAKTGRAQFYFRTSNTQHAYDMNSKGRPIDVYVSVERALAAGVVFRGTTTDVAISRGLA